MLNKKRTLLIGFVIAALMVSPAQAFAAPDLDEIGNWTEQAKNAVDPTGIYPPSTHDDISAAGISYSGYDDTKTEIIINELERYAKAYDSESAVYDPETAVPLLVNELLDEFDKLYTQYELLNIEHDRDANNDATSRKASKVYEDFVDTSDRALQVLRDILKGPYGGILKRQLTTDQQEFLSEYEDMTKREKKLIKEEDALVQEYDKLILNADNYEKDNKKFARIYLRLVEIRRELAQIYGYKSYPAYAYKEVYSRDYSCKDARALAKNVKKYIVPLFSASIDEFYDSDLYQLLLFGDDGDTILKRIAPYIDDIDPQLKRSFNYLRRHHTYDLDYTPNKLDVGYTVDLPQYGALYIFNNPYRETIDYTTTVHEFGHYNAGFHNMQHVLLAEQGSYDIAEIQSQGLEMLFLDYYDELFGDAADVASKETFTNILSGVVTGCMYDEFQQEVFRDPNMNRKKLNALSARLAEEYGLLESGYVDEEAAKYDWVAVTHTFESPMYYISYATSALSALDILAESSDDRDAAVEKYMNVSAVKSDVPYLEGLKQCGLKNVFDKKTIKYITKTIKEMN
ncbi:MAG: hypothetical protein IJL99_05400 [Firmicutes bacterium]|nr:hypothetical protein [Bacillota bacterium]